MKLQCQKEIKKDSTTTGDGLSRSRAPPVSFGRTLRPRPQEKLRTTLVWLRKKERELRVQKLVYIQQLMQSEQGGDADRFVDPRDERGELLLRPFGVKCRSCPHTPRRSCCYCCSDLVRKRHS